MQTPSEAFEQHSSPRGQETSRGLTGTSCDPHGTNLRADQRPWDAGAGTSRRSPLKSGDTRTQAWAPLSEKPRGCGKIKVYPLKLRLKLMKNSHGPRLPRSIC